MSATRRRALYAACLWTIAASGLAQEPPAEPPAGQPAAKAGTTWHSQEPPPADAGEEAPADEAPVPDGAAADEAAPADGAAEEGDGADEEFGTETQPDEDGDFVPKEKIRADSALSFPSDI